MNPAKAEALYLRALKIREDRRGGLWLPIMWHLALRRHADAMIELADWLSHDNRLDAFGRCADAFSAAGLYRRAFRAGDARAAQHLAMSCFNRNDMAGYRHWLKLGAKAGDPEAVTELSYFETRLPHGAARAIGRARPRQKRDWV
ncbi:hypothetical protein [Sphingomonas montanisoli]|uniref:Sel1 repeat family protein n=1 Tax=Sphingomonas montanisoli TaxID=2606412 RepID=A0A5D9C969_9SPHN|nr:hypothetical protein [Sphingomonas montanisoli]TZG27600.1 hypothetical protein FYJ91_08425 [Sphingomonas montanisoli]